MIRACNWISEMSLLSLVITSCCRLLSILKPFSNGCVYVADQLVLYAGSKSAVKLLVVCRLLFSVTARFPPPVFRLCDRPPLNVVVPELMPVPACWPWTVELDACVCRCCERVEVSEGL